MSEGSPCSARGMRQIEHANPWFQAAGSWPSPAPHLALLPAGGNLTAPPGRLEEACQGWRLPPAAGMRRHCGWRPHLTQACPIDSTKCMPSD